MRVIAYSSDPRIFLALIAASLGACSGQSNANSGGMGGAVGASSTGGSAPGGATGSGGMAAPSGSGNSPGVSTGGSTGAPASSGGAKAVGGAPVQPGSGGAMAATGGAPGSSGAGGAPPAAGGSAGAAGASAGAGGGSSGTALPPVDKVDADGPFAVTIDEGTAPNMGWVAHPTELGKGGVLHPIFTWGCGGGSQPSQYKDHLTRIASHGFVVEAHVSNGDASEHKAPLDWLIAQNDKPDSPFYKKLDVTKIAAGGHSMGSISTFAFEAAETRLTTTIHVAGGSFDGNGYKSLKTPTLMVDGSGDTLALSNTQRDYMAATVPTFLTVIQGSDHIYAARDGLPPIVAWLRWHLAGETQRKSMFIGANCDFCGGKWAGQSKNW